MDDPAGPTISPNGNIRDLLEAVGHEPLEEIFQKLKVEKREAEILAKHVAKCGGNELLREHMFGYVASIRCLIYWLRSCRKRPRNCDCFPLFRPLTESLVSRGLLDAASLAVFDVASSAA